MSGSTYHKIIKKVAILPILFKFCRFGYRAASIRRPGEHRNGHQGPDSTDPQSDKDTRQ